MVENITRHEENAHMINVGSAWTPLIKHYNLTLRLTDITKIPRKIENRKKEQDVILARNS
jgi:hypothetical protein